MSKNTPEKNHGIACEPDDISSLVSDASGEVEQAKSNLRGYEKADEEGLRNICSDIENNLGSLDGYRGGILRDIESRSEDLKQWGSEWRDYALGLHDELEELKAQLEQSNFLEQISESREIRP